MKIAIHKTSWSSFSADWISYCINNEIQFQIIDGFNNNIIKQTEDCDIILWHHHHTIAKDKLIAQKILYALEQSGKIVFPDWRTAWHFDDKLGQKYLLESINAPIPPSFAFYDKSQALNWSETASFPKVFKLRGGAGSLNVKLVNDKYHAQKLIQKAFGKGFPSYDKMEDLRENMRRLRMSKGTFLDVLKSLRRYMVGTDYSNTFPYEKGYIYFQEFMSGNDHDIRIITIGDKAIGIKRMVRKNDFRASGSGHIIYNQNEIDIECIKIAFDVSKKLKGTAVAYDFVYDKNRKPVIVEINYGFAQRAYDACPGWWDEQLHFHHDKVNPCDWMLECLMNKK